MKIRLFLLLFTMLLFVNSCQIEENDELFLEKSTSEITTDMGNISGKSMDEEIVLMITYDENLLLDEIKKTREHYLEKYDEKNESATIIKIYQDDDDDIFHEVWVCKEWGGDDIEEEIDEDPRVKSERVSIHDNDNNDNNNDDDDNGDNDNNGEDNNEQ